MRYIADSDGYVKEVSFGADIVCDGQECTEYTGEVPTGYASLEAWFMEELEKLYRWKIVGGNLTLDSTAVAPSDKTPAEILAELGVADYVVETGTSGTWTYEKWASGKLQMFAQNKYSNQAIGTAYGGYYFKTISLSIPDVLVSYKFADVTIDSEGTDWAGGIKVFPETNTMQFYWCNGTAYTTLANKLVSFYIEGTWK